MARWLGSKTCPNCKAHNSATEAPEEACQGGIAYRRRCKTCGLTIEMLNRPADAPPLATPDALSTKETERLRFVKWQRERAGIPTAAQSFPIQKAESVGLNR